MAGEHRVRPYGRVVPRLLLLLCLILAVLLVSRAVRHKPVPPPAVVHYTPQQAATAQRHLDTVRTQLLQEPPPARPSKTPTLAPTHPVPETSPVRLELSQADLNTYLATDPAAVAKLKSHGVQAVQIVLSRPHNILCRAAVVYRGHPANLQIAGALLPSTATMLRLNVTSAQVGDLPLPPKFVTAQADKIAAQLTAKMRRRLPITISDVRVVGDHVILTGTRQKPPNQ